MKLRVLPWFTDGCVTFLNNLFKWYPALVPGTMNMLEWGGGNSTLYFLQRGLRVVSIEPSAEYLRKIESLASELGYRVARWNGVDDLKVVLDRANLLLVDAELVKDRESKIFDAGVEWHFVVNDGVSRESVMNLAQEHARSSILVVDNIEYCANWGRLERCAAHPTRVRSYRKLLRDTYWRHCLFEQAEGRELRSAADATGWEAPHRWISGVFWGHSHLLSKLVVSSLGFPVVTVEGAEDGDIETIPERCPFDWTEMRWMVERYDNVFALPRAYE